MKKNLRDIKGFVFDFDGVFYTDKGISGKFGTLCDATVAKIAPRLLKQYGMTAAFLQTAPAASLILKWIQLIIIAKW